MDAAAAVAAVGAAAAAAAGSQVWVVVVAATARMVEREEVGVRLEAIEANGVAVCFSARLVGLDINTSS